MPQLRIHTFQGRSWGCADLTLHNAQIEGGELVTADDRRQNKAGFLRGSDGDMPRTIALRPRGHKESDAMI